LLSDGWRLASSHSSNQLLLESTISALIDEINHDVGVFLLELLDEVFEDWAMALAHGMPEADLDLP